jgi:hypothetical protein
MKRFVLVFVLSWTISLLYSQKGSDYYDLVYKEVVVSKDSKYALAIAKDEPRILVWEIQSGKLIQDVTLPYSGDFEEYREIFALHFTKDSKSVYIVSYMMPDIEKMIIEKYNFNSWELEDEFTYKFNCDYNKIQSTSLSHNDQYLAIASEKKTIVFDLVKKALVNEYCGKNYQVNFSYENNHIVTICDEGKEVSSVNIWELNSKKKAVIMEDKKLKYNTAWFSADGKYLKLGYWQEGCLNYINFNLKDSTFTNEEIKTFSAGFEGKGFIDSKNDNVIVETNEDGINIKKGEELIEKKFKNGKLFSGKLEYLNGDFVCSPDGKYLVYQITEKENYIIAVAVFNIEKEKIERVLMPVIDDDVLIEK